MGNFRKGLASVFTAVLFGGLILSFLFLGNGGAGLSGLALGGGNGTDVVVSGHRRLSAQDFKNRFEQGLKALGQQYNRTISDQEAIDNHLDEQMLPLVAGEEARLEAMTQMGIVPGAQLVAGELRKQPEFFNPVSGKFDRTAYLKTLADNNLDPKTYEQSLSDQLASADFGAGEAAGVSAPRTYGAFVGLVNNQLRSFSYVTLDQSKTPAPAKPTDAQLTAFMNENADNFRLPERRVLSVVHFSAKALAPTMTVDPALVQKQFDFRKDSESKPETRSLIQVVAKDQNTANSVSARLMKGEDPQAVAKAVGAQAIVIDDKPKTAVADPKVATVAFSMKVGETSGAIKGDLGYSVVKVTGISPGKVADINEMRPKLEEQVREQEAEQKVSQEADKYSQVKDTGADMAKAAAAAGAVVTTTPAIVAQGVDPDTSKPVEGLSPKLLQTAFKQAQGSESDIISDGRGEYFVVRVDKIFPPSILPLDAKVRPELEKFWLNREVLKALKAKADDMVAKVKKGQTLEAVATSEGLKVQHVDKLTRDAASQKDAPTAELGSDFLSRLFDGKKGDAIEAPGTQPQDPNAPPNNTIYVGQVDDIATGDVKQAAQSAVDILPQIRQTLATELAQSVQNATKAAINPKTYPDRAKRALGIDPTAKPAPKKAAAG